MWKYIEFIDHDLDIDYDKEMARIRDEMRLLMVSEELSQSNKFRLHCFIKRQ